MDKNWKAREEKILNSCKDSTTYKEALKAINRIREFSGHPPR